MPKKIAISREISWLSFNARVLQEANNPAIPLKEQIRFLGIHSNNRDEFFRTKVPVLKKMIAFYEIKQDKYHAKIHLQTLNLIQALVLQQQDEFDRIWKKIVENLKKEKVLFVDDKHLDAKQQKFVTCFFEENVSSSIIPLLIDQIETFPSFKDQTIFLGIMMRKTAEDCDQKFAIIEIPTKSSNRFISLPAAKGKQKIMLLEDIVRFNLPKIFSYLGYHYFEAHTFKVTRDAEITIDQDISASMIQQIKKGIKNRHKARAIRFQYEQEMNADLLEILIGKLHLSKRDSIIRAGHIRNFCDFMNFPAILPQEPSKPQPFKHPQLANVSAVSEVVLKQDVLLHFPYHSFNSLIDLLREAAMDPSVLRIRMTAYRLAPHSRICNALINAARNGKDVHVVLELSATFDEEANLAWKAKFEEEGIKVSLGIPNMKVHAKICVIKKKVGDQIHEYGFVGTGNLHEKTAQIYTDHFLLTSNPEIMADLNHIFNALENPQKKWWQLGLCKILSVSPLNMRDTILLLINDEIKAARSQKPAKIIVNINALSDKKLTRRLYKAASVGVEIKMIVRGIFCAETMRQHFKKPITAISIIDEYLEHSRIWLFHHAGQEKIFIGSADWMGRNLDNRVEVAVPILDPLLKEEIKQILKIKLSDTVKARRLDNQLENEFVSSEGKKKVRSQRAIYYYLKRKAAATTQPILARPEAPSVVDF